ncbi:E3 ubiquitin-protein ligase RNF170-like [Salvia hispanica]|uniref:E3 ubiquitin-protein ligase RNF170-like n=1 Tax=Salvia hispanica TaxID=49212 RepID=UPI002009AD0D|nr:E3 ubiquitin-protein ligase RNF170-like [Salvia hispanica]
MEKEAGGVVGVAEYRDGYEDLRKKEEKCNENGNEIEYEDGAGDDVCPICLDTFTNPCRSNCGHLFCGGCILQLWIYRYSIQPCKCPLCCCRIVNLELQTSEEAGYSSDVRKEVQHYNGLYISGLFGALHILPLLMGRVFRVLVDLDYLRCIYYVMCVIGLFLGLLYERLEFEFLPTGGLGIQRMFDLIASLLVAALFLLGVVYRWMLKRRARLLVVVDTSLRNVT